MKWAPPKHPIFAVGDTVWVYLMHGNRDARVDGKVVAVLTLPGWSWAHYVVEIDTPMDPLLYVYDGLEMLREPDAETLRIEAERERRLTQEAVDELYAEVAEAEARVDQLRTDLDGRLRELNVEYPQSGEK